MNHLKAKMEFELAELDFIQPGFKLSPFAGGTINSSYLLESADKSYFVKTFESDQINPLDRQKLFKIQQELAFNHLSVQPLYLSKGGGFQVDQWLDTPTLDKVELSNIAIIKKLAETLATIHMTKIDAPTLDLPKQWSHYIKLTKASGSIVDQVMLNNMAKIWQDSCASHKVFCHNDLALSHVTFSQPVKIFDWEYCAISSPYFDLASCIAVNNLTATDQASLCEFYAQYRKQSLCEVSNNVSVMQPLVSLTYKLWFQCSKMMG
jgi:thiamine kinase